MRATADCPTPPLAAISPTEAMLSVSRAVATRVPLPELLNHIAELATSVVRRANATAITLVNPGGSTFRIAGSHGLSSTYREAVGLNPVLMDRSASATAVRLGDVVQIDDPEHDSRMQGWSSLVRAEGYRGLVAVPFPAPTLPVGSLVSFSSESGEWGSDEIQLLRFFAEHSYTAIYTAQLLADGAEQVRALERLVTSLEAHTHEHSNQLHAVNGLLALGDVEEASVFVRTLVDAHRASRVALAARVQHPLLAGLLIAQASSASQREIQLEIGPTGGVGALVDRLTPAQLVSVVGNLVDNALDAVADQPGNRRVVTFSLVLAGGNIVLEVGDRGPGFTGSEGLAIDHGVTTKPDHAGAGLAIVRRVAESVLGHVEILSTGSGSRVRIIVPETPDHV
jgi:signal transduction histidine kinase